MNARVRLTYRDGDRVRRVWAEVQMWPSAVVGTRCPHVWHWRFRLLNRRGLYRPEADLLVSPARIVEMRPAKLSRETFRLEVER